MNGISTHQGGVTAYENREVQARLDSTHQIAVGQAFAWNPSITGTKSEDTMLLTEHGRWRCRRLVNGR
jgi:hypothetical protein